MKHLTYLIILILVIFSCGKTDIEKIQEKENLTKASFQKFIEKGKLISSFNIRVKAVNSELKDYPQGYIPWIDISKYDKYSNRIIDSDKIIWTSSDLILVIDYPLTNPYKEKLLVKTHNQFTLKYIVSLICDRYKKIYNEEELSSNIKVIPINERKKVVNRNETNGKYGIWGHDIEDLALTTINIIEINGEIYLSIDVDS